MDLPLTETEMKRSSAAFVVLALLAEAPRHGYEIGKLIESRSEGTIRFNMASLYPLLYRLEGRGWIAGQWAEEDAGRRRRQYRITTAGRAALVNERALWRQFVRALDLVAGLHRA